MNTPTISRLTLATVCFAVLRIGILDGMTATVPIYLNPGTTNNAQVDALRFSNSGQFTFLNSVSASLYATLNTSFYTNTQSGTMSFNPGVKFELLTNTISKPARVFENHGLIEFSAAGSIANFAQTPVGRMDVKADRIVSHGQIRATTAGVIHLEGKDVDLERGGMSSSLEDSQQSGFISFLDLLPTNYSNPFGVEDVYWGASRGGRLDGGTAIQLNFQNSPFPPPPGPVTTPFHQVVYPAVLNVAANHFFTQTNYASYVWTNQLGTNRVVQIVMVNTNTLSPDISVDVRFERIAATPVSVAAPIVRFGLAKTNRTLSRIDTNFIFFADTSMAQTNQTLAANLAGITFRPRAFQLFRGNDANGLLSFSSFNEPSNAVHTSDIVFPLGADFTNTFTTNYAYYAWAGKIGTPRTNTLLTVGGGRNQSIGDPTNLPGRVEIVATNLNLKLARIEAENTIQITTSNLISAEGAIFSAPNLIFNVARENDTISLTNFVPDSITNFNGFIQAYSAVWTNRAGVTREGYQYHVLMLDASLLGQRTPVSLPALNIRSTNIIVQNKLNAARSFNFDSPAVTFNQGTELRLNAQNIPNLQPANFPRLRNFTNFGIISAVGLADLSPTGTRLNNYVHDGILLANTININATNYESAGTNAAFTFSSDFVPPTLAFLQGNTGGPLTISADAIKLQAEAAANRRGRHLSIGDITLQGKSLKLIEQDIITPARFIMRITNSISDGGATSSNTVTVGRGFEVSKKATNGDLLGTAFESTIPQDLVISHTWPAENRGKTIAGYSNNMAVGRLILSTTSLLGQPYGVRFLGAGTNNALYVDLLDLRGSITNENFGSHFDVHTNMVIYFANASPSVEFVLNAVSNANNPDLRNRIQWVKDFTGPNSSQPFSYIDSRGVAVQVIVNSAKFNSPFLDSDGDGVANSAEDELNRGTPFDGVLMRPSVTIVTNGAFRSSTITWRAARETIYRVESSSSITNAWGLVTNVFNPSQVNNDFTFTNSVPTNATMQFYRVGYTP